MHSCSAVRLCDSVGHKVYQTVLYAPWVISWIAAALFHTSLIIGHRLNWTFTTKRWLHRCHCFNKTCTFGSLSGMPTADGGGESPPDKKDVFVPRPTCALLVMARFKHSPMLVKLCDVHSVVGMNEQWSVVYTTLDMIRRHKALVLLRTVSERIG
jgi:hypothetical protein